MKPKKLTLVLFVLSFVGLGIGFILKSSTELGLCLISEPSCINLLTQLGNALFYSMQAIAAVFIVLLLVPQAFTAWKKFAVWYLPLMFIYFVIYENGGFFSIPEESVYRFLSIVYAVISLTIIAFKALQTKSKI